MFKISCSTLRLQVQDFKTDAGSAERYKLKFHFDWIVREKDWIAILQLIFEFTAKKMISNIKIDS